LQFYIKQIHVVNKDRILQFIYQLLYYSVELLVHGQVTIIFVVSVCLFVCLSVWLFVQSFSQPSLIRFWSNLDICYMSGS